MAVDLERVAAREDEQVYRDTRPLSTRYAAFWQSRRSGYGFLALAGVALVMPGIGPAVLLLGLINLLIFFSRTVTQPIHIPVTSPLRRDPADPKPGNNRYHAPRGIYYLGNTLPDNEEVWINKDTLTTHAAYLATTGGGKTGGLTSMLVNTFIQGSGAFYTDGKAQMDIPVRVMSIAHRFGRLHDCLFLNFMQGDRAPWQTQERRTTHRFSFLLTGSPSAISETLLSLLKVDDDMWGQRAKLYLRAISYIVVYLRDTGQEPPTLDLLTRLLELNTAIEYANKPGFPEEATGLLIAYLRNLPGAQEEKEDDIGKQFEKMMEGGGDDEGSGALGDLKMTDETLKQHGFITMQLVPLLATLQYEYTDQLSPRVPDIDIVDVAVNNRILYCALPALEKSSDSVAALGRMVVAATKAMMAGTLYTEIEGDVSENLDSLPTNADTPYPVIWDEIGAYFTEDHGTKFAMARSLNFYEILGTQDLPAMKKLGDKAAKATETVLANTAIKLIGRMEDGGETLKYVKERADQGVYAEQSSLDLNKGAFATEHIENSVSMVRRDRLNIKKLGRLNVGEVYIIWKDRVVRTQMFFADVARIKRLSLPAFVPRPKPESDSASGEAGRLLEILRELNDAECDLPAWRATPPQMVLIDALRDESKSLPELFRIWREDGRSVMHEDAQSPELEPDLDPGLEPEPDPAGIPGARPEVLFGGMPPTPGGIQWRTPPREAPKRPEPEPLDEEAPAEPEAPSEVYDKDDRDLPPPETPRQKGEYEQAIEAIFAGIQAGAQSAEEAVALLSRQQGGDPETEAKILRESAIYNPPPRNSDDEVARMRQVAERLAKMAEQMDDGMPL